MDWDKMLRDYFGLGLITWKYLQKVCDNYTYFEFLEILITWFVAEEHSLILGRKSEVIIN